MSRRSWLIVAVLAVAVAGILAALVFRGSGVTGEAAASAPTAAAKNSPTDAQTVAAALRRLTTDPGSLVASADKATIGTRGREAVPSGTKVDVDEASWAPDGAGGGTIAVTLTVPGKPAATYLAVMVREADGWKVLATVPVTS